jgi:hypothetical protein
MESRVRRDPTRPHWTKVLFAAFCTAGKIIFDYVIRRPNVLSAG